jgi:ribosomal protein S18 acetylase RimI-like enzyme
VQIRRLIAADARAYWETRNRGLKEFPDAFTTTYEEGLATSPEKLALRFGGNDSDDFVLGAFASSGGLAGCAGFQRELRLKNRHRGTLIGMYVVPEFRGQRVGRLLLDRLIAEVRSVEGMERLNLTVTHSNEGARMLYLKAGFISFGLEKNALKIGGRYHDKEYMVLVL